MIFLKQIAETWCVFYPSAHLPSNAEFSSEILALCLDFIAFANENTKYTHPSGMVTLNSFLIAALNLSAT